MNNQIPFGYNPNIQPIFPGVNESNQYTGRLDNLEQRINMLENKIKKIETKLNMNTTDNMDYTNFNPYQSSMHMM